jgi:glycosyltransferase involved in cell wall biosynthesis
MLDKTEEQIMQNWKQTITPVVTITCVVFNHEKFIEDTLNGFLSQNTSYSFEVLIHDDVSTDGTIAIIEEYRKKFPNIIKPFYQKVNQYSQGNNPLAILFSEVRGEYMAHCDGDDYWSDENKLQIQIDEMKKYPELDMSFHYATGLIGNKKCNTYGKQANENRVFTTQEVILGGGEFCPTSSLIFRTRLLQKIPKWFYKTMVGDYPIQVLGAASGEGALYINKNMSIYRVGDTTSWTSALKETENSYNQLLLANRFLNSLNETLEKKYDTEFANVIANKNFAFLCKTSFSIEYRERLFREFEETFTTRQKIAWCFIFSKIRFIINLPSPRNIKLKLVRWFC